MRAGNEFGDWVLLRRIGGGGNGEVWLCRNGQGEEAAIKVLRPDRRGRMRLARFRDEIAFLLQHGTGHEGILPILDHDLSEDGGLPWFVMPLAQTLPEALGEDPEIGMVIEALAAIAGTLASLHERGVGHRDIKPDNLFARDGRWLVGDFGLVTYPEKDAVTEQGRRLGAIDYLAPEMRDSADTAAFGPSDVHSLAKVLWVTVTGRPLPLPGPHRADDPAYSLATYVQAERLVFLDRLLEHATSSDPAMRPKMGEFADELSRWLAAPHETGGVPEIQDAVERLTAVAEVGGRAQRKLAQEAELAAETFRNWTAQALYPLQERLASITGVEVGTQHHHAIHVLLPDETLSSGEKRDQFSMATSLKVAGREEQLHCAIGMQYFSDGRALVAGGFFVEPARMGSGLWTGRSEATLGSVALEDAISDLTAKLHEGFAAALGAFMKRVGA